MEFDLEYKLQQFREAQSGYYDGNGKRYSSTPISTENAELMLEIINELESALANAETELGQLTIPVVMGCKHENEQQMQGDGFVYTVCADCGEDLE